MPRPLDLQDHYGVPPSDYWTPSYFDAHDHHFELHLRQLRSLLAPYEGASLLDCGAGNGQAMRTFQRAGFEVHGFEPSRPFWEYAVMHMGIPRDRLLLSSIEDAEYPAESFDVVFFNVVLEHLQDPAAALTKALSWLKPGGILSAGVPSADWLVHRFVNTLYRLRGTDHVANLSPMHEPYHLYEFTLNSFKAFARRSDAEVVHHQYFVCDTYLPKWMDRLARPLMKWTNTGMELRVWMRKR